MDLKYGSEALDTVRFDTSLRNTHLTWILMNMCIKFLLSGLKMYEAYIITALLYAPWSFQTSKIDVTHTKGIYPIYYILKTYNFDILETWENKILQKFTTNTSCAHNQHFGSFNRRFQIFFKYTVYTSRHFKALVINTENRVSAVAAKVAI